MLKLLLQLFAPATKATPMNKQKPPSTLHELRPNTGAPAADWAVAHQSAFPWLNTVAFLPARSHDGGPDLLAGPVLEAI